MAAGDGTVMLGYVHNGTVRAEFMSSVLAVLAGPRMSPLIGGMADASAGPLVAMARNMLAARFLESDLEWLWCVDTDIAFAPDTLARLLESADPGKRPVVSALYWIPVQGETALAAYTAGPDASGDLTFDHILTWDDGTLMEVDGCGAGCLLIHRSALEDIRNGYDGKNSWFTEFTVGPKQVGEDLSFCIRLANIGIPLHLHTGIEVGHVKPVMIGKIR